MAPLTFDHFITWLMTTLLAGAGAAGGLWWLIQKALEAKLGKILEEHKTSLASQLHKQNTVFSRIDQQRADVIQKLSGHVCAYRWELMDFSPKTPFGNELPPNPTRDVMMWCMNLCVISKAALRTSLENSLILPSMLPLLISGWHSLTYDAACDLMNNFVAVTQSAEYLAANVDGQRAMITGYKKTWDEAHTKELANGNNAILNELRILFDSVDRPANAADKFPVDRVERGVVLEGVAPLPTDGPVSYARPMGAAGLRGQE